MAVEGTSSERKVCIEGCKNICAKPSASHSDKIQIMLTSWVSTSTAKAKASAPAATEMTMSTLRRLARAMKGPMKGPGVTIGKAYTANTSPGEEALPVIFSTSSSLATIWNHVPMFESACPTKK